MLNLLEGRRSSERKEPVYCAARYYTPAVVAVAGLIAVIPPLMFGRVATVVMGVDLPSDRARAHCHLRTIAAFSGIGGAARQGILVRRQLLGSAG